MSLQWIEIGRPPLLFKQQLNIFSNNQTKSLKCYEVNRTKVNPHCVTWSSKYETYLKKKLIILIC